MSAGEFLPSGGASRRKKPLSAAQRRKVLAAYKSVKHIQQRNDDAAEAEAHIADDILDSYFQDNNAQNKDHHNTGTGNGQSGTTKEAA